MGQNSDGKITNVGYSRTCSFYTDPCDIVLFVVFASRAVRIRADSAAPSSRIYPYLSVTTYDGTMCMSTHAYVLLLLFSKAVHIAQGRPALPTYLPGHLQSSCCVVVITSSWPLTSVARLQETVLVSCVLCVHGEGVLVDVWFVRWQVYRF